MTSTLGKTLLIANPAAQNGKGADAAQYAREKLEQALPEGSFELLMTQGAGHGFEAAKNSCAYDTVIALGGDGLIHEVANGLMNISDSERPVLGVLPSGSGNDYARTLNMSFEIEESVPQLLGAQAAEFDLGVCNGEYFIETLSFGLDAAIALDTVERRKKTGKTGTALFLESGIDVLLHKMRSYSYHVSLNGGEALPGKMFLFAVQIGKTYGGGFTICPDALTDDGMLDLCIAHPPLSVPKAVFIFLLAKNAHHTRFKQLEFDRVTNLVLTFEDGEPPIQIDGEPLHGTRFEISCAQKALKVLVPR